MSHYLKHHFISGTERPHLQPRKRADGSVDHYDLDYVQNAVRGQVLAAFVGEERADEENVQALSERRLPAGKGTGPNPDNPDQLLASTNGHVLYRDGLITVEPVLRVPADVDYTTGNISFVGELDVHGGVRSGFQVSAQKVLVRGVTEAAKIIASASVRLDGGLKGAGKGSVQAGGDVVAAFCENGLISSDRDVKVRSSCLHSRVFAGHRILVKERLIGGEYHAYDGVFVGEQLGGGLSAETEISLGYDPALMLAVRQVEQGLKALEDKLPGLKVLAGRDDEAGAEYAEKYERGLQVLDRLTQRRLKLLQRIEQTARLGKCALLVPGAVRPGVVVHIGPASLKIDDFLENVRFTLDGHEIRVQSPAR